MAAGCEVRARRWLRRGTVGVSMVTERAGATTFCRRTSTLSPWRVMGMIEMDGVKTTDDARDRRIAELVDEVDGLRAAMANRAAIEQAKGLIIAARGCTPDEAFELLSRMSQ